MEQRQRSKHKGSSKRGGVLSVNSTQTTSNGRSLGAQPSQKDLDSVIFAPNTTFGENEIVLVPRTRGGFSYGKVIKQLQHGHCYFDLAVEFPTVLWRVIYSNNSNGNTKSLFKDLPSVCIGKLRADGKSKLDEDDIFSLPDRDSESRMLGTKPSMKDLNAVVFSPQCSFVADEIVLVPRSKGGFTYAKIHKAKHQPCMLHPSLTNQDEQGKPSHYLPGWRVVLSDTVEVDAHKKVPRKDICSPCIGKIMFLAPEKESNFNNNRPVARGHKMKIDYELPPFDPAMGIKKESEAIVMNPPKPSAPVTRSPVKNQPKRDSPRRPQPSKESHQPDLNFLDPAIMATNQSFEQPEDNDIEIDDIYNVVDNIDEDFNEVEPHNDNQLQPPQGTPPTAQAWSNAPPTTAPVWNTNQPAQPSGPLQIGGILAVDKHELLKKLMTGPNRKRSKHLIIIDGPNVARVRISSAMKLTVQKHGKDSEISSEGLRIALEYWNNKGHDAIAFLPQHYVKRKPQTGTITLGAFIPVVTDIPLVMSLIDKGKVVLTPPQDYDDSYCIDYAMSHDACIVSNDRYWDAVDKMADKGEKAKNKLKNWLKSHVISFTFVRDEFMPNPNFTFPPMQPMEQATK